MKKCEGVRDLILTDYIDGELDKKIAGEVESHLLDCSDCRVFFKEVKNNAAMPFQGALPQPVPARLWATIKESIEVEHQNPLADFIEKLKAVFAFPRMVPVLASLILMVLAGSVVFNTIQIQQAKDRDQGEYMVSLLSQAGHSQTMDNDWGTPIEHYFL